MMIIEQGMFAHAQQRFGITSLVLMAEKDSFSSALKRAREIAAKMHSSSGSSEPRRFTSTELSTLDAKKSLALQIANNLSQRMNIEIKFEDRGIDEDGNKTINAMIPAVLVGVVLGKDGENLRSLQDRTGVQMQMEKEEVVCSHQRERILVICGDPVKADIAKEILQDYVKDKHQLLGISTYNMQLALGIEYDELEVPKEAVGMVIGKQGETIKKVNSDTGCLVKFKPPVPEDDDRVRICTFQGTIPQIQKAKSQIRDIVEMLKRNYGLSKPVPSRGEEYEEVKVSASRAGVVIGKGGENIRQINNLSGARVCIDRTTPDNSDFRIFTVVGTRQQIEHAKFLIREKSGEAGALPIDAILAMSPGGANPMFNQAPPTWNAPPGAQMFPIGPDGIQPQFDQNAIPPMYGWDPMIPYGQPGFSPGQPMTPGNDAGPPSTGNEQIPPQTQQDYSAAWAAYYQMYQQQYNAQDPSNATGEVQPSGEGQMAFDPNAYSTPEAYAAAYQAYCQQYYAQYPEYYQQWVDSQNVSMNQADTSAIPQSMDQSLSHNNLQDNSHSYNGVESQPSNEMNVETKHYDHMHKAERMYETDPNDRYDERPPRDHREPHNERGVGKTRSRNSPHKRPSRR